MDKFKQLKKKQVKWKAKVAFKAAQTRRDVRHSQDEFKVKLEQWYTYAPSAAELAPFKNDQEAFRKSKQGEVKLARAEDRAAIEKAFDDYEAMYEAREKERLQEIFDVIAEVLPKSVAQAFVDNVNLIPLEVLL